MRVAGLIPGTPALPGGGAFVMLPLRAAPGGTATAAAPANLLLLGGGGIDGPALRAVARRLVPGAAVTLRSDVLASLAGAPLQHGAYVMFAVVLAAAAAFGLAALLADLALGAADRHQTLARLATMGVDAGQARRLVLVEKAPALLAAAVAGTACALVLPALTAAPSTCPYSPEPGTRSRSAPTGRPWPSRWPGCCWWPGSRPRWPRAPGAAPASPGRCVLKAEQAVERSWS